MLDSWANDIVPTSTQQFNYTSQFYTQKIISHVEAKKG